MNRLLLILTALLLATALPAQNSTGFQIGTGVSYDFGVNLPSMPGFEPYGKGGVAMYSFDGYIGIPMGRLTLYPSYILSVPARQMIVRNLQGDYLPEGYSMTLPYSENNPGVIFSQDYYNLSSLVDLWQRSWGTYALFHIGAGVELGTGVFRRKKIVDVYSEVLFDEYYYFASNGTLTDEYSYWDTYWNYTEWQQFIEKSLAFPLVFQWRYEGNFFYSGMSLSYWLGDDPFFSIRYSAGLNF